MSQRLATLALLYFVQGLPFGFQATALPLYLRSQHVALGAIGLTSALALPWMLKALWAPAVDRYVSVKIGRRRTWILPMQFLLAVTCVGAAWCAPSNNLPALIALVFLMNLFAATMDIAVDGLAIDILRPAELGYGNITQVVGYKLGMLTGGGLLVWLSDRIGWHGLFLAMAGCVLFVFIITLFMNEHRAGIARDVPPPAPSLAEVIRTLGKWLKAKDARWLMAFVATYKIGESMADLMFKPFLQDEGFTSSQVGLWVGTWGMVFSLVGSFAGGILASRKGIIAAVTVTAVLRIVPVAGEWWLSLGHPTAGAVIAVTCAEHFFGGALTTAVFAYMMSKVDRRIGATHYTFIATVEVFGKTTTATLSGYFTEALGYPAVFGLATVLSFLFLGLVPRPEYKTAPAA